MDFHIKVEVSHHRFLRLHLLAKSYHFGTLPFRLSSPPHVFMKTLASLITLLWLMSIQLYLYLDSLIIVGNSPSKVTQLVEKTMQVLTCAGFVFHLKKLDLYPTQDLVYIGARFCTDLGRLYLPDPRVQALITCSQGFSKGGVYKPSLQFLGLLGLMAATLQAVEYAHLQSGASSHDGTT